MMSSFIVVIGISSKISSSGTQDQGEMCTGRQTSEDILKHCCRDIKFTEYTYIIFELCYEVLW